MSRSRRKTPIIGVTAAESDKAFKAAEHRRERAAVRAALAGEVEVPHRHAFGDPWDGPKDGKLWQPDCKRNLMRK